MRILSFIFAAYFFALAVMPCGDDTARSKTEQLRVATSENAGHDCDDSDEACSPLCMCHCCGGITLTAQWVSSIPVVIPAPGVYDRTEFSITEVSFSIWQPPKLG